MHSHLLRFSQASRGVFLHLDLSRLEDHHHDKCLGDLSSPDAATVRPPLSYILPIFQHPCRLRSLCDTERLVHSRPPQPLDLPPPSSSTGLFPDLRLHLALPDQTSTLSQSSTGL